MTDTSGSTKWWYDERYRVSKEEKTIGAKSATTEFQYNAYQLTGINIRGRATGPAIALTPRKKSRSLRPRARLVDAVLYNPFGQMTQIDFSSAASQTYSYYPANEGIRVLCLKNITVNGAQSTLMNRTYTYNKTGTLGIDDSTSLYDQSFEYDDLTAGGPDQPQFYRRRRKFQLQPHRQSAEQKRPQLHLTIVERTRHSATASNVTAMIPTGTWRQNDLTFQYDADNRLISLSSGERFEYDFSGRRVQKTDNNATSPLILTPITRSSACAHRPLLLLCSDRQRRAS